MLSLDTNTVILSSSAINICVGLILLAFTRRPSVVHLHWCGVAICYGIAGLLIGFREFLPAWLANVIANILVGLSVILIHRGTWIMVGRHPPDRGYAVSLVALGAIYYQFTYPTPDVGIRLLAVSLFRVPYFVSAAVALRSTRQFSVLSGTKSLFWLLSFGACWYFLRGVSAPSSEAWAIQMRVGIMQSLNFLIASVVNVMITVSLFRLDAEQALQHASDLTLQLQNQLLLQQSLIEAIPAAVFYKNEHGIYLGCNRIFAEMMGKPADAITGQTVDDLLPGAIAAEINQSDQHVYRTHALHTYEFVKMWGKDGERHMRAYKAPFDRADGSLGGLIGIVLDISSDIRREDSLRQAKLAAEQANQAKSQFLAMMSHELRTPMTGVIGMADFLTETPLNADQKLYVDTMRSSARTLMTVLNDILDYSKIEANRLTLDCITFDAVTLTVETVRLFQPAANEKANTVSIDTGGLRNLAVRGDPNRVRQVLGNLIANAVKFTDKGEIMVRLRHADTGDRCKLLFEVEDTGIGISEAEMGRLFQPFSQIDVGATRKFGGTGLGLAIGKRIVEMMGGEISAVSGQGKGATFRFTCVVERAIQEDFPACPQQTAPAVPPMTILVAEDNPINRMIVKIGLERRQHRVTVAENGVQAWVAAAKQRFDMILMDMQMPLMDGTEATRRIRALPTPLSLVPIVALSADALSEHRAAYMEAGLTTFLTKPVDWNELDAVLARIRLGEKTLPAATTDSGRAESEDTDMQLVDSKRLLEIRTVMTPPDFDELVRDLFPCSRDEMARLRDAIAQRNLSTVHRSAHTIKGMFANIGGLRVSALARRLQACVDIESAAVLSQAVFEAADETEMAFSQFLTNCPPHSTL